MSPARSPEKASLHENDSDLMGSGGNIPVVAGFGGDVQ
jgi:hypothetical protein